MSTLQIVRAWKDGSYRNSLTSEERAALPANPAGKIELLRGAVAVKTNGQKCSAPPYTYWCGSTFGKMMGSTCA